MKMKWVLQSVSLLLLVANLGCQSTVDDTRQLSVQQTDPDYKVFVETQAKAERGDAEAQYNLGEWYANGKRFVQINRVQGNIGYFLSRDFGQACKWLSLASAKATTKLKHVFLKLSRLKQNKKHYLKTPRLKLSKETCLPNTTSGLCIEVVKECQKIFKKP